MNKTLLLSTIATICLIFSANTVDSQISHGGIPSSFNYPTEKTLLSPVILEAPNKQTLSQEDVESSQKDKPYRIGKLIPANLNMNNSGHWDTIEDGSRMWRLTVKIPYALGIGVFYDHFYIPQGGRLFLYNKNRNHIIGSFTDENNNYETGKFVTEKVQGDEITLEYIEPLETAEKAIISIEKFGYFYRGCEYLSAYVPQEKTTPIQDMGKSASCNVNANCSEGNNYRDAQRSVIKIEMTVGVDVSVCSGSLINNTNLDCTPYVLTASHCDEDVNTTDAGFDGWMFFFNYESPTCENPTVQPTGYSIGGAKFRSRSGDASIGTGNGDFLLLELSQRPPQEWNVYYAGWDLSTSPTTSGVGIHHPSGDIKKISTLKSIYAGGYYYDNVAKKTHWKVLWDNTTNGTGVTEGGSSGSPLFNTYGRIIGHLSGGSSQCDNLDGYDAYGMFSYNWASNGTTKDKHLKEWLDPKNDLNIMRLDGKNNEGFFSPVVASFTSNKTFGPSPLVIRFTNTSTGYPVPSTFTWKFGDSTANSTSPNPTHVFKKDGIYNVWLIVENGITKDSAMFTYNIGKDVSINNINYSDLVNLYPNPTEGIIKIKFGSINQDKANLNITNSIGETIYTKELKSFSNSDVNIDLSDLTPAIYYLNIQLGNNIVRKKISIIH